jgi:uncharacterized protein YbcC (UPF0753/DUF2309 family)
MIFFDSIEYKHKMARPTTRSFPEINQESNIIMSKWLAIFMDEGLAEWEMLPKRKGFIKMAQIGDLRLRYSQKRRTKTHKDTDNSSCR